MKQGLSEQVEEQYEKTIRELGEELKAFKQK
jgi:hypothetical protein